MVALTVTVQSFLRVLSSPNIAPFPQSLIINQHDRAGMALGTLPKKVRGAFLAETKAPEGIIGGLNLLQRLVPPPSGKAPQIDLRGAPLHLGRTAIRPLEKNASFPKKIVFPWEALLLRPFFRRL